MCDGTRSVWVVNVVGHVDQQHTEAARRVEQAAV